LNVQSTCKRISLVASFGKKTLMILCDSASAVFISNNLPKKTEGHRSDEFSRNPDEITEKIWLDYSKSFYNALAHMR